MTDDLDQAFARIERLAGERALPAVTRSTSYGTPALKVHDKTFVRLREAEVLVLPCPSGQKALLMEISPHIYFETPHYVGHGAVLIHLDAIADEELSLRLEDAWRHKAPTALARELPTSATAKD